MFCWQVLCNTGNLREFPSKLPNVTQDISITNQNIQIVPKYVSIEQTNSTQVLSFQCDEVNIFITLTVTLCGVKCSLQDQVVQIDIKASPRIYSK